MAQKRFVPTDEQRSLVRKMAGFGVTHRVIANCLPGAPISEATLRKHFATELKVGASMSNLQLARTAYQLAVEDRNPTMLIFLCKTRLGWKETTVVETTGKDGAPLAGPVLYLPTKGAFDGGGDSTSQAQARAEAASPQPANAQPDALPLPALPPLPPAAPVLALPIRPAVVGSIAGAGVYPRTADPRR